MPASRASSTAYWISGRSTTVSISLGMALVAGRKRVPSPATGKTALRTGFIRGLCFLLREYTRDGRERRPAGVAAKCGTGCARPAPAGSFGLLFLVAAVGAREIGRGQVETIVLAHLGAAEQLVDALRPGD